MRRPRVLLQRSAAWLLLGAPLLVLGAERDGVPALELVTGGQSGRGELAGLPAAQRSAPHEALMAPGMGQPPGRIGRTPPAAIVERPGAAAPGADARWIEGYWDWNEQRGDFEWVTGTWLVPPPGKFWVRGYWRRDSNEWLRVAGFWSDGGTAPVAGGAGATVLATSGAGPAGPPRERPQERVGPAPGPDYFYIAGEYVPQGSEVVWRPGFWYPSQPGWEWMPAHWVCQASGWTFREGSWHVLKRPGAASPAPDGSHTPTGEPPGPTVAGAGDTAAETSAAPSSASAPAPATAPGEGTAGAESGNGAALVMEEKPAARTAPAVTSPRPAPLTGYPNPWGGTGWNGGAPMRGILGRLLAY